MAPATVQTAAATRTAVRQRFDGYRRALTEAGLAVERELVVFGIRVAQDPWAIGAGACQRLFERMDGDSEPPRSVIIPTRLLARGSGEIRPG